MSVPMQVEESKVSISSFPPSSVSQINPVVNSNNLSRGGALTGFTNTENTCYLNAILQALLTIPAFVNDLFSQYSVLSKQLVDNSFYTLLQEIAIQTQFSDHGVIDIKRLKDVVSDKYSRFSGNQQQDAHEFLSECLNYLNDDIKSAIKAKAEAPADLTNLTNNSPSRTENKNSTINKPSANSSTRRTPNNNPKPNKSEFELLGSDWARYFSPSYRNFHCEIEYTLVCTNPNCGYTRMNFEHFHDFSLDIPESKPKPVNNAAPTQSSPSPSPSLSPNSSPEPASLNNVPDLSLGSTNSTPLQIITAPRSLRSAVKPSTNSPNSSNNQSNSSPTPLNVTDSGNSPNNNQTNNTSNATNNTNNNPSNRPLCPLHKKFMHKVPSYSMYVCRVPGCKQAIAATVDPAGNYNIKRSKNVVASLSGLLQQFFEPRLLDLKCSKCDNSQVKITARIRKLPRVLILHLKRFQPNWSRGTYTKRSDRVFVDQLLDLGFACTEETITTELNYKDTNIGIQDKQLLNTQIQKIQAANALANKIINNKTNNNNNTNTDTKENNNAIHDDDSDSSSIVSIDSDGEPIHKPAVRRSKRKPAQSLVQNQYQDDQEQELQEEEEEGEEEAKQQQSHQQATQFKRSKISNSKNNNNNKQNANIVKPLYSLQSVVQHRGAVASSGHYITDIKQNHIANPQKNWLRYDDQFVKEIPAETALRQGESEGYIFFFVHQDLLTVDQLVTETPLNIFANNLMNTANNENNLAMILNNNNNNNIGLNNNSNNPNVNYSIGMRNNNIVISSSSLGNSNNNNNNNNNKTHSSSPRNGDLGNTLLGGLY